MYPKKLEKLIESFMMLPGVGQKTAERYALSILDQKPEDVDKFSQDLSTARHEIQSCKVCHNLADEAVCQICQDETRDRSIICVVATAKEAFSIEKMNEYHGVYHVLGGLISTQKGILPENLNIQSLINRVDENVTEVILALNATVEGEMTSLYLAKKLEDQADVSRLAFGLPIGGHLDYADDMTLMKAFEGRSKVK
ncbi:MULTISPECIES: recombination mediator RecR [Erysipelothrix]|uniref:recombination mediator RecR n=1 Tax=Erysipelothrix TaxID=1647 RepID=UPI0013768937|nr:MULTISPECIES: recombination mediator RecR [unclassified Erysipelothrix]MBK2402235.1 recombination protein RecR [Erysipelothrix sp. strain 2 (EsS2-6-Brazil)]MBK2404266.1 recombination protein RecR [Erysipelothrix sp. strain 2 (EsS2-7-Brazil)]NBA01271.1 recombination protein RecR [Erysipelothrix rhusiopathiae]